MIMYNSTFLTSFIVVLTLILSVILFGTNMNWGQELVISCFLSQFPSVMLFRTNMNWGQEYVILIGHVPLQAIAYPMFSM